MISSVLVAVLLAGTPVPTEQQGWRELRFGMSKAEATAALQRMAGKPIRISELGTIPPLGALFADFQEDLGPVRITEVRLMFAEGKLWSVEAELDKRTDADAAHRSLVEGLREKYGVPAPSDDVRSLWCVFSCTGWKVGDLRVSLVWGSSRRLVYSSHVMDQKYERVLVDALIPEPPPANKAKL